MGEATGKVEVTIRIDTASADRLDDIVRDLGDRGVTNIEVHKRFLVVNGSIAESKISAVQEIAGVASVRKSRTYKTQT